jgi:hypothetical protein
LLTFENQNKKLPIESMATFTIRLHDQFFRIAKKVVVANSDLFDLHPELYDAGSYEVESEVDAQDLETFLNFLGTQEESLVTTENYQSLLALADEFSVSDLFDICSKLEAAETSQRILARVSSLEAWVAQQAESSELLTRDFGRSLCEFVVETVSGVSAEVHSMRKEIEALCSKWESSQADMRGMLEHLRVDCDAHGGQLPMREVECPAGILSCLEKNTAVIFTRLEP